MKLTPREIEILTLMRARKTNLEIARRLCISVGTVKAHVRSIYRTLGVIERRTWAPKGERLVMLERLS